MKLVSNYTSTILFGSFLPHCEAVWWSRWSWYERYLGVGWERNSFGENSCKDLPCPSRTGLIQWLQGCPAACLMDWGTGICCTATPPFVLLQWFLQLTSCSALGKRFIATEGDGWCKPNRHCWATQHASCELEPSGHILPYDNDYASKGSSVEMPSVC